MARPSNVNPTATPILDELCAKWPDLPSRTLARMAFNQNKGVFASIDHARCAIRYRRGRNGWMKRRDEKRGAITRQGSMPSTAPSVPWVPEAQLPKSYAKPFLPYLIEADPKKERTILCLSDIHLPYHDAAALAWALEVGREIKPDVVLLNGDTLDFHRLSRFEKDVRKRSTKDEIAAANQLLDVIDELFPKALRIWKDGNHDERYEKYIMANAGELFELVAEKASLDKVLELEDRGWHYVTEKRPIYAGELTILHGHEYPTPVIGPVNAARGLFLRTKQASLVGHHHQTSEHNESTVRGTSIEAFSTGCLCELHPEYARFNKWNHGFAEIALRPDGSFHIKNRKRKA